MLLWSNAKVMYKLYVNNKHKATVPYTNLDPNEDRNTIFL